MGKGATQVNEYAAIELFVGCTSSVRHAEMADIPKGATAIPLMMGQPNVICPIIYSPYDGFLFRCYQTAWKYDRSSPL